MSSTLLLRLAGPMQSWGSSSRFTRRLTDHAPTKSGIIGMLAAARGLRRSDPLTDLLSLDFGIRIDQPGRIERDFQTARPERGKALPLTERFYISDAVFVAGVSGNDQIVAGLAESILRPEFPLYLGRRAFPAVCPISLGTKKASLWSALTDTVTTPWQAAVWYQNTHSKNIELEYRFDENAVPDAEKLAYKTTRFTQKDEPKAFSFDPNFRDYGIRRVLQIFLPLENVKSDVETESTVQDFPKFGDLSHNPLELLGGG